MLCEHASADVAGEGLLPAVRLQVNLQVTGRLEALPTEPAAVRPVHRVVLLVRAQVCDGAEPPAADHTRTGDGGRVGLEVFPERVHAGHRGAARHAGQRPLPGAWVGGLLVHLQGTLLDETLAAGLTAEGALPSVDPLMALQSVRLVEALATSLTPEGLFPRVDAQMALQVSLDGEAFVAVLAVVGPLPRVDHLMHLQAVCSVEALPALLTAERPDLGVQALVVPQQLLQSEALPTNITGVWSLTCMKQHVSVEAPLEGEASATLRAAERLLCVGPVRSLVGLQVQQLGERLPAESAAQRLLVLVLLLRSTS